MKVVVFGAAGMVGNYIVKYMADQGYDLVKLGRSELDIGHTSDEELKDLLGQLHIQGGDTVINCAGILKKSIEQGDKVEAIAVNSVWPHILAGVCEQADIKCFHISTDGVFRGDKGEYSENEVPDAIDFYGQSKILGEPDKCAVLRVCPIGEEAKNKRSLFEWVKLQKNEKANGFANHIWNGMTGLQLAKVFDILISEGIYWQGLRHIHSPDSMSKAVLVKEINQIYDLNIEIVEVEASENIDRTLSSEFAFGLEIPSVREQLVELKEFGI